MTIPPDFYFSQARLQDYVECRRRFQLRYLLDIAWPAVEAEPVIENESHLQMGEQFHHLIHQHLVGINSEQLSRLSQGKPLQGWWQNYLDFMEDPIIKPRFSGLNSKCFAEISLSSTLGGYRLIGKFDAIAVSEDQGGVNVSIYDWKTSTNRPPRAWLANRLQTRIYPY
ncbi:MAG: PD-(D/E)XK nuclease family protein, partial [Anaerolineales bacterium]